MNTPSSKYSPKYSGTELVPAGHSSDVDISLGNPVSEQNTILYRCRGTRAGEPNVNIAYVPRGSKKNTFYLIIILAIAILNNNYCCVLLTLVKIFFIKLLCHFASSQSAPQTTICTGLCLATIYLHPHQLN